MSCKVLEFPTIPEDLAPGLLSRGHSPHLEECPSFPYHWLYPAARSVSLCFIDLRVRPPACVVMTKSTQETIIFIVMAVQATVSPGGQSVTLHHASSQRSLWRSLCMVCGLEEEHASICAGDHSECRRFTLCCRSRRVGHVQRSGSRRYAYLVAHQFECFYCAIACLPHSKFFKCSMWLVNVDDLCLNLSILQWCSRSSCTRSLSVLHRPL